MERDSNIISYSPHYRQMPAIIRDLARAVQDLPDVCLIVKPHPEDRDRLAELRSFGSARVRLSEDLSLPSLLAIADVVVTVNSTVGLEALTRRKPVLVLGQAIYGEKGFTFDLESPARLPERLRESLAAAQNGRFNEAAFHRFLAYLLTHSLFRLNGPDPWGSRDHISQRILSAAASTRGAAPPHSPKLETLRTKNRELLAWLPGPKAGASGPSSLFLLSPQAEVAEFLPRILPQTRVETLDRSNVGRRLVPSLSRSYDAALSFGYPAYPRRVVWALVRARQKFHLC
jgi:CDP-glycerol glycerophosphotransferase (TagB/SpsB family)